VSIFVCENSASTGISVGVILIHNNITLNIDAYFLEYAGGVLIYQLTSSGLVAVGDLVSQMYRLKTELPSTKPTLKFA
jgi:hypothetical protein